MESYSLNFPHSYRVGTVPVSPATVLAPMAGVTDTVFRRLIRNQCGCGLLMTEFTSSHGVVSTRTARKHNRNFRYLQTQHLAAPHRAGGNQSQPGRGRTRCREAKPLLRE